MGPSAPGRPTRRSARASAPIVVGSPWPVWTTVSAGSGQQPVRIESRMVGKSEYDRPGRARAALEQGVAAEDRAQVGRVRGSTEPGEWPGRVQRVQFDAADGEGLPVDSSTSEVVVGVRHLPQHVVGGCSRIGASSASPSCGRRVDVVVVAVGAARPRPRAAADGLDDRLGVVRGVEHDDLGVVADDPDVVVDVPTAAVEAKVPDGDQASMRAPSQHHHRAQDLAARASCRRPPRSRRARSSRRRSASRSAGPAGRGRSASGSRGSGRQSPYQDDFSAPPRPKKSSNGSSSFMSGRRHARPAPPCPPGRGRRTPACRSRGGRRRR